MIDNQQLEATEEKKPLDLMGYLKAKQAKNSAALVRPARWDAQDVQDNLASLATRNFAYKVGEWTVRQTSNGVYLATRGIHKVFFHTAQTAVGIVAALRTIGEVLWESLTAVFHSVLRASKTASEVATRYAKEVGTKLKTSMTSAAKPDEATTTTISPKGIVVSS